MTPQLPEARAQQERKHITSPLCQDTALLPNPSFPSTSPNRARGGQTFCAGSLRSRTAKRTHWRSTAKSFGTVSSSSVLRRKSEPVVSANTVGCSHCIAHTSNGRAVAVLADPPRRACGPHLAMGQPAEIPRFTPPSHLLHTSFLACAATPPAVSSGAARRGRRTRSP